MGFKTLHSISSCRRFTKPHWVMKGSEKFFSKETLKSKPFDIPLIYPSTECRARGPGGHILPVPGRCWETAVRGVSCFCASVSRGTAGLASGLFFSRAFLQGVALDDRGSSSLRNPPSGNH